MAKSKSNGVRAGKVQTEIPGTAPPDQVDAIDDAAADYLNGRSVLLNMRKEVLGQKNGVLALMREHKRKRYVYRDGVYQFVFTADDKSELHVKREHEKKREGDRPRRSRRTPASPAVG